MHARSELAARVHGLPLSSPPLAPAVLGAQLVREAAAGAGVAALSSASAITAACLLFVCTLSQTLGPPGTGAVRGAQLARGAAPGGGGAAAVRRLVSSVGNVRSVPPFLVSWSPKP